MRIYCSAYSLAPFQHLTEGSLRFCKLSLSVGSSGVSVERQSKVYPASCTSMRANRSHSAQTFTEIVQPRNSHATVATTWALSVSGRVIRMSWMTSRECGRVALCVGGEAVTVTSGDEPTLQRVATHEAIHGLRRGRQRTFAETHFRSDVISRKACEGRTEARKLVVTCSQESKLRWLPYILICPARSSR